MSDKVFRNYKWMGKLVLMLGVLSILLITPLSAAKKSRIKLPDGLYMYNSSISQLTDGRKWVGFGKYFVAQNNIIYNSKEAIEKIGIAKINKLFTENKNYKILLGGEIIGEIYDVKILSKEDWNYEEKLFIENIKEGPMFGGKNRFIHRYGSAVKCLAVPKEYKEVKKKVYTTITQKEVDKITKLSKEKLFDLVKNIKAIKKCQIIEKELVRDKMELLDKISVSDDEMYIGIYSYTFRSAKKALGVCEFEVLFSTKEGKVSAITINDEDEEALLGGDISICGMLDVDGDDKEDLIIEKVFGGEPGATINLEIYKQKSDGDWTQIKKINTARPL